MLAEDKKAEALALRDQLVSDGVSCDGVGYQPCDEFAAVKQSYLDAQTMETISFVAGGTLTAAAIVMAIVWPSAKSLAGGSSARPVVAFDQNQTYLGVVGQF